jgi:hypothetical protein
LISLMFRSYKEAINIITEYRKFFVTVTPKAQLSEKHKYPIT